MNKNKDITELYSVISKLRTEDEVKIFLTDLCTPTELSAMADRWKAVKMIRLGLPYREIYEKTGVSTATITRVARCLSFGAGGYKLILDRTEKSAAKTKAPTKAEINDLEPLSLNLKENI